MILYSIFQNLYFSTNYLGIISSLTPSFPINTFFCLNSKQLEVGELPSLLEYFRLSTVQFFSLTDQYEDKNPHKHKDKNPQKYEEKPSKI